MEYEVKRESSNRELQNVGELSAEVRSEERSQRSTFEPRYKDEDQKALVGSSNDTQWSFDSDKLIYMVQKVSERSRLS